MSETRRLLEAAVALSALLKDHGVAHAFHGNVLTAVLANGPHSDVMGSLILLAIPDSLITMPRKLRASAKAGLITHSVASERLQRPVKISPQPFHPGPIGMAR